MTTIPESNFEEAFNSRERMLCSQVRGACSVAIEADGNHALGEDGFASIDDALAFWCDL